MDSVSTESSVRFISTLLLFLGVTMIMPADSTAGDGNANAYASWENGPPSSADYFPIAVWLQSPSNAARYQEAGINLYVGLWKGPTEEQLDALRHAEMPVICSQNAVGLAHSSDPIIIGWMHGDEPDNAQSIVDPETGKRSYGGPVPPPRIVEDYQRLKQKEPTRPVLLNLGQGVANDEWRGRGSGAHISDYLTYVQGADVVSFDVYPVVGIRKPDGENYLWYVAKGVSRLAEWTQGNKILWNCIECTHISNPDKKATPHQVRAEAWMSLIHGSTGLIWFVHQFQPQFREAALLDDPEMLAAVTQINHQIHELAPVLNSPTVEGAASVSTSNPDVPVAIMVKRHAGATYLFSVGMRNGPTTAAFGLTDIPDATSVQVLGENRQLRLQDGQFIDSFAPYDVHLYRIGATPAGTE